MDVEVLLPQRGMGMKEATVIHWYVKVGDAVREGDKLVGIESSKATDEILAPVSGIVIRIDYNEDEEVEVGEVLGRHLDGRGLTIAQFETRTPLMSSQTKIER